jgi:predicted outer membrane protein
MGKWAGIDSAHLLRGRVVNCALVALVVTAATAGAVAVKPWGTTATASHAERTGAASLSPEARQALVAASRGGMLIHEATKLAAECVASPQGKTLASQLATDPALESEALYKVAKANGIATPTRLTESDQAALDALRAASGQVCDHQYATLIVSRLSTSARSFERIASGQSDLDLRPYAQAVLPKLQEQLTLAHTLLVGSSAGLTASTTRGRLTGSGQQ